MYFFYHWGYHKPLRIPFSEKKIVQNELCWKQCRSIAAQARVHFNAQCVCFHWSCCVIQQCWGETFICKKWDQNSSDQSATSSNTRTLLWTQCQALKWPQAHNDTQTAARPIQRFSPGRDCISVAAHRTFSPAERQLYSHFFSELWVRLITIFPKINMILKYCMVLRYRELIF